MSKLYSEIHQSASECSPSCKFQSIYIPANETEETVVTKLFQIIMGKVNVDGDLNVIVMRVSGNAKAIATAETEARTRLAIEAMKGRYGYELIHTSLREDESYLFMWRRLYTLSNLVNNRNREFRDVKTPFYS